MKPIRKNFFRGYKLHKVAADVIAILMPVIID